MLSFEKIKSGFSPTCLCRKFQTRELSSRLLDVWLRWKTEVEGILDRDCRKSSRLFLYRTCGSSGHRSSERTSFYCDLEVEKRIHVKCCFALSSRRTYIASLYSNKSIAARSRNDWAMRSRTATNRLVVTGWTYWGNHNQIEGRQSQWRTLVDELGKNNLKKTSLTIFICIR